MPSGNKFETQKGRNKCLNLEFCPQKVPACQRCGNKLWKSWHLIFHNDSYDIHEMYAAKSLPRAGLYSAYSFSRKRAAHFNLFGRLRSCWSHHAAQRYRFCNGRALSARCLTQAHLEQIVLGELNVYLKGFNSLKSTVDVGFSQKLDLPLLMSVTKVLSVDFLESVFHPHVPGTSPFPSYLSWIFRKHIKCCIVLLNQFFCTITISQYHDTLVPDGLGPPNGSC